MKNDILNAALEYLEMGLSIIPIRPKDKRPLVPWEQYQKRLATAEEMESWFDKWSDANIALVTGKLSNVVAIDADSPGRVKWLQETFPTSVSQKTGNGMHGFFKPNNGPVKTQVGVLDKVDVRGDGGYVVIAPSIHETGRVYTLQYAEGFDAWDDLTDFPYNIFPSEKSADTKAPVTREPAAQGERNATLTRLAGRYCKAGLDYDQVLVLCANDNKTYSPPLPDRDVETICRSIYGKDQRAQDTSDVEVVTVADINDNEITLQIPDDLIRPGGLIDLGVKGMLEAGLQDVPQFYMPVILSHIANAIAGKIVFSGIWPLFYNVKIAGSSTGKSRSDKILKNIIEKRGDFQDFYGPSKPASGAGILMGLQGNPQQLMILDEMQSLFKRYGGISDPVGDSKREELLGLYSEAGGVIKKSYGSAKNSFELVQPCLNVLGNTTLGVFDSIKMDDFASGLIPRMEFWCFDGKIEATKFVGEILTPGLEVFCDQLAGIYNAEIKTTENNLSWLNPYNVFSGSCQQILDELLQEKADFANNPKNQEESKALVARKLEIAVRYGMVHHASVVADIFSVMSMESMEYGRRMADMLVDWKIKVLGSKVTTGDLHRRCELFKKYLALGLKNGKKTCTFKYLSARCTEMKNWSKKETGEVIDMLVTRDEILINDEKNKERYVLIKGKE